MQFKIDDRIINPVNIPKNKYRLNFRYMHGDASKYEEDHVDTEDVRELEMWYEVYICLERARDIDSPQVEKDLVKIFKKYPDLPFVKSIEADGIVDWIDGFIDEIPGDCTCDGQNRVAITDISVSYFDNKGNEKEVDVTE